MLRSAVRELAEDKIAPRAAEIDETGEFPWDVYEALRANDFHAIHIPERFGGQGGDALAACLVIEEVARVCASSSLIPAVNKLGTMPLLVGASDELLGRYLPQVASGEAMFSYALSEREAGSDAGSMKCRAVAGDGGWVLNGQKSWISNAGVSKYYTVMAVTEPGVGPKGISAFVVHADDPGFALAAPERKLGIHGSPTREILFDNCWIPADRIVGEPGTGFQTAMRTLDHTRVTIGAQALGIAQGALDASIAYAKERKQFGKTIGAFQGVQFLLADMAMKVEAARALTYAAAARSERGATGPDVLRRSGQVLRLGHRDGGHDRRRPGVRRRRLRPRQPGRALHARREDHPDLRGDQPDPAHGDGSAAAEVGPGAGSQGRKRHPTSVPTSCPFCLQRRCPGCRRSLHGGGDGGALDDVRSDRRR